MKRGPRQHPPQPRDESLRCFDALLDHLGRLLAEEYVAILMSTTPVTDDTEEA